MRGDDPRGMVTGAVVAGRLAPGGQTVARFHREADRRLRRRMALALACSTLLVAGVLGIVGLKVQQVRLSYRLDGLRAQKVQAEELNRRLHVELATLGSLARIESRARADLGMVPPDLSQVRLAREYVTGGTGLSGPIEPRTAAAPGPAPEGRGIR